MREEDTPGMWWGTLDSMCRLVPRTLKQHLAILQRQIQTEELEPATSAFN